MRCMAELTNSSQLFMLEYGTWKQTYQYVQITFGFKVTYHISVIIEVQGPQVHLLVN